MNVNYLADIGGHNYCRNPKPVKKVGNEFVAEDIREDIWCYTDRLGNFDFCKPREPVLCPDEGIKLGYYQF